jgi:hypothetical protein
VENKVLINAKRASKIRLSLIFRGPREGSEKALPPSMLIFSRKG